MVRVAWGCPQSGGQGQGRKRLELLGTRNELPMTWSSLDTKDVKLFRSFTSHVRRPWNIRNDASWFRVRRS